MIQTGAAFSVRFLRNGDQITITSDILDQAGNGAALFQVIDPTTGTIAPDWTVAANQPIVQLAARSASGYPVRINNVVWYYDGTELLFVLDGENWVTATNDSRFKARITSDGKYCLRVSANLASLQDISNKMIAYEVDYTCNGINDSVKGHVDVLIQASGSDSHILQITTDRVEIREDNPDTAGVNESQATLTAVGYYGTTPVTIGQNGYTIEWYKNGNELISGATSATLVVTREMVAGSSLFVAKLKLNGNVVAQDSQRIADIADEYQVNYRPRTPAESTCSYDGTAHNAVYLVQLVRNGVAVTNGVTYSWTVYNSLGVAGTTGTGATVTVTPADCLISGTLYGEDAVYGDADVQVTAEFGS